MTISDDFSKSPKSKTSGDLEKINPDNFVSEDLPRLRNDLYVLNIHDNLDGRLKFMERWEAVAEYIFGAELLSYDYFGTPNKGRRAWLENQAEERRLAFIDLCNGLEDQASLPYIGGVIERFGLDISLHLYAPEIVEYFSPLQEKEERKTSLSQNVRDISPETMSIPMLSASHVKHTEMVDRNLDAIEQFFKDPFTPFAKVALPSGKEVQDLVIAQASIPKRSLRTSWKHLMYRYEDEEQCD